MGIRLNDMFFAIEAPCTNRATYRRRDDLASDDGGIIARSICK